MIRKTILSAVFSVFALGALTSPALASHCPVDVKKLQAALASLDKDKMATAKEAAAKGLALHQAGNHAESLKVLHGAMEALGVAH